MLPRPTIRDILQAVLRALVDAREPLDDDLVLVPAHFEVYVHPQAHAELLPLLPRATEHIYRRLDEELARLNRPARRTPWERLARVLAPLRRMLSARAYLAEAPPAARYERAGDRWHVTLAVAAEPETRLDTLIVETDFAAAGTTAYGGHPTVNIRRMTRRVGDGRYETQLSLPRPGAAAPAGSTRRDDVGERRTLARIDYTDDAGQHTFYMRKAQVIIGRDDDPAHFLDIALQTLPDVSREHARIRYRDGVGFEIKDVSRYGVEVEGRRVESSLRDGEDVGRWHALPERAEISLAHVVTLRFESLVEARA